MTSDLPTLPEGARFTEDGIYAQVLRHPPGQGKRPALFLDRDGCIVVEAHYLHKVEDVALIDGAAATIARANRFSIPVVIVTNQAGIGYGYFGWQSFLDVQTTLHEQLSRHGAYIDAVYACPFHVKGLPPYKHPNHPSRKPNPGMLLQAQLDMNIDLNRSWIVGDRSGDLEAGRNAKIEGGVHVLTGHGGREGEREGARELASDTFKSVEADSLADAYSVIPLID